jgi:hypothetical protein
VPEGAKLEVSVYNQTGEPAIAKTLVLSPDVSVQTDGSALNTEQQPISRDGSKPAPLRAIFETLLNYLKALFT